MLIPMDSSIQYLKYRDSRFNELFSGLSRRHDGNEAKKLYEKNHSMIDRSKQSSNNYDGKFILLFLS